MNNSSSYKVKIDQQVQQFANNSLRFFPPEVHRYWMQNYVWPKIDNVFGTRRLNEFYCSHLLNRDKPIKILSIGSGDGQLELSMAKYLIDNKCHHFVIHTTELSPLRQTRTIRRIEAAGLQTFFQHHIIDLNQQMINDEFDLVFAHHVLHHLVELESLFERIHDCLHDSAVFASIDMIGRNGHMRWPEALDVIELAWNFIPDHWKYNFQHQKYHETYLNHDCSSVGFEGIRSQDILALLIQQFAFEGFVGCGGFIDVLFDRGYGQSIDMSNRREKSLVTFLSDYNELLLETGRLKPTMMFAKMRRSELKASIQPRIFGAMTPEFAIREA